MVKDIWTGKEPFLRDPEKEKKNLIIQIILGLIGAIIIILLFLNLQGDSTEPQEEVTFDDLAQYRNLTTKELLKLLNEEKGFKDLNPLRTFEIEVGDFYYEPNQITVNKDDKVRITLTSVDNNHSIRIPGFFIDKDIIPGTPTIIEFIANREGEFVFYELENENMRGKVIIQ